MLTLHFVLAATEIQNLQVAEGDIARNLPIPLHIVFPRLFSCPTTIAGAFKIEFELNLIVIFASGYMITENFPLSLTRTGEAAPTGLQSPPVLG